MSKWGWATRIGGYAASPFTFGMSVPAANMAASAIERKQASNDQPTAGKPGDGSIDINQLLKDRSDRLGQEGSDLRQQGQEALSPVLDYFKKLIGGDPAAMMEATAPERGKVIDQYDAARNAVARFAPRGGGQGSAIAGSYVQQAQQLGDITSQARQGAVAGLAQLGPQLQALGLNADQVASMDLNALINAVLTRESLDVQKRGQTMAMWSDVGSGVGDLLGQYLTREGGMLESKPNTGGTGVAMS